MIGFVTVAVIFVKGTMMCSVCEDVEEYRNVSVFAL